MMLGKTNQRGSSPERVRLIDRGNAIFSAFLWLFCLGGGFGFGFKVGVGGGTIRIGGRFAAHPKVLMFVVWFLLYGLRTTK